MSSRSSQKPKPNASAFSFSPEIVELEIEKLSFGGDGIGRHEGLVYFVPLSVPGDLLRVQTTEKKKNFVRAEILEILRPSAYRIQAPCPVFGRCGGCAWQNISYEEQLHQKQMIVEEQLSRVITSRTEIRQIIPSPLDFRYRNRIQLKYDGHNLGFYARQSHQVVDIDDCPITETILTQEIRPLKQRLQSQKSQAIAKIELLKMASGSIETVFEDSPFEGAGFSQVNSDQNENLTRTILQWMSGLSVEHVYDFYAGAGNFTFPLFNQFPQSKFVAVELSEKSVQIAQDRIRGLNISPRRMQFYLSDVEHFLKRSPLSAESVVLLDPPRSGCSENVLRYLGSQKVQKIFYISCNPASLARDLTRLREHGSWLPLRVQPFDMFPQTDHVETLVELEIDSL
jgi:23S rRNA (uracil1939-C5)-methyltransferase